MHVAIKSLHGYTYPENFIAVMQNLSLQKKNSFVADAEKPSE
jgi:hypothetical protein